MNQVWSFFFYARFITHRRAEQWLNYSRTRGPDRKSGHPTFQKSLIRSGTDGCMRLASPSFSLSIFFSFSFSFFPLRTATTTSISNLLWLKIFTGLSLKVG